MPIGKVEENFPDSVNMESQRTDGVQRVLAKLEASIEAGNYYEAHQMYTTLYFRYIRQKKYAELLDLLYDGANRLLEHEQYVSGAEIGSFYLNVLNISETQPTQSYFDKITHLFSLMSPSSPERDAFLQSALRWSIDHGDYRIGHSDLHNRIAQVFWKEKNYIMAKQHYLRTRDGSGCALMLIEFHEQHGYSNELDLFIAQVVLQYLCLRNKAAAQEAFNLYTDQHPKISSGPPYLLPLLNFLFFLLKTIDSGKLELFTVLCEQYEISLNRDPTCTQYLDKIRSLFFNAPPSRPHNRTIADRILNLLVAAEPDPVPGTPSSSDTEQEVD